MRLRTGRRVFITWMLLVTVPVDDEGNEKGE